MSVADIILQIQTLPKPDKIRILQVLVDELAKDEGIAPLKTNRQYPVFSPFHAFEAASTMLKALKKESNE